MPSYGRRATSLKHFRRGLFIVYVQHVVLRRYALNRSGFSAIAEVYNQTVVRDRGNGASPISVGTIVECWSIFAVLKMAQGVGERRAQLFQVK